MTNNFVIKNEVEKAYDYFKGQKLMLEKFVPFKMEVSVIASRNTKGEIKTFPLVENIHEKNMYYPFSCFGNICIICTG